MKVIESIHFRLASGITEKDLLKAASHIQGHFFELQHGFQSRQLVSYGSGRYAEQVFWLSRASADAARLASEKCQTCQEYRSLVHIDKAPEWAESILSFPQNSSTVQGMEFSRFRLRSDVDSSKLVAAANQMARDLYHGEPGFEAHMVMRHSEHRDQYADVIFADSAQRALSLCQKWGQGPFHPACSDYLNLIDPESVKLEFWDRLS